jgi:hypothetical protein
VSIRRKSQRTGRKAQREHQYFGVVITYTNGETSANKVFKGKVEEFAVAQEARHEERDAQTVRAGCVQCAQDKEKPRTPFVRPNVPLTLMDEVFGGPALL